MMQENQSDESNLVKLVDALRRAAFREGVAYASAKGGDLEEKRAALLAQPRLLLFGSKLLDRGEKADNLTLTREQRQELLALIEKHAAVVQHYQNTPARTESEERAHHYVRATLVAIRKFLQMETE